MESLIFDPDEWASRVARALMIDAPKVDVEAAEVLTLGRIDVDCTGKPGMSYSMTETQVLRPGYRFLGGAGHRGEQSPCFSPVGWDGAATRRLRRRYIVRSWDWPEVKGTESFSQSVEALEDFLVAGRGGWQAIWTSSTS